VLVLLRKYGRLGNRLFSFAHVAAFAEKHGCSVLNLAFNDYAGFFEGSSKDLFVRYPSKTTFINKALLRRATRRALLHGFDAALTFKFAHRFIAHIDVPRNEYWSLRGSRFNEAVGNARIVVLNGFLLRDNRSVREFWHALRRYFQPVPTLQVEVNAQIAEARSLGSPLVGVHVRRGDYARWRGGKYFFPVPQYELWIERLSDLLGRRTTFLVCSDEQLSMKVTKSATFGGGHPVVDMYSLAECDVILGPPSTFSAWASFIGRKPLLTLYSAEQPIRLEDASIVADWRPLPEHINEDPYGHAEDGYCAEVSGGADRHRNRCIPYSAACCGSGRA
jgi:hypothetical protein